MNKFILNLIKVSIGNGTKLVATVLIGLLLPIIFDPENYGYYKIFIMYNTYFALFHFGFTDGIYLFLGGKNINELDNNYYIKIIKQFIILFIWG
jgi:O-antigen/teichoic acid export membrane protein